MFSDGLRFHYSLVFGILGLVALSLTVCGLGNSSAVSLQRVGSVYIGLKSGRVNKTHS
jgi:hypothetical protein